MSMSISPDEFNLYQCIFSTSSQNSPLLPFYFINQAGANSSYRYGIQEDVSLDQLKPFICINDRSYYEITVIDTSPQEKSSLDENLERVIEFDRKSLIEAGIPGLAFPYLTLTEYTPTVPDLLDAWQDEHDQEFVIISSTQNWQTFNTYLAEKKPNSSDVFAYLQQMAKLWKSFTKLKCSQTLLYPDNLGVSEDNNLQIKKLYFDDENNLPLLRQLVETWVVLLSQTKRPEAESVEILMMRIEEGEVDEINQLRASLDDLFQESQLNKLLEEDSDSDEQGFFIPPEDELNELTSQFDFQESDDSGEATVINNPSETDEQPTVVLPMRLLSLAEVGVSDIGMRRGHNEDCFAVETQIHKKETPQGIHSSAKGFFVVCDGMGGHAGGEVASAMAVKTLYDYFQEHWIDELPSEEVIKQGVIRANTIIYDANIEKGKSGSGRMGTTVVMALVQGTKVALAHVGDSRIYRVTRKWGLEQLTVDHSVAQAEIKNGVEYQIAFSRPDAYQLTQALGPRGDEFVRPDVKYLEVKEDTLFLLCSDGLSDNSLLENNWQNALLPLISAKANIEEGASYLIDLANQVNGHDNITCILARIKVQPNLEQKNPIL